MPPTARAAIPIMGGGWEFLIPNSILFLERSAGVGRTPDKNAVGLRLLRYQITFGKSTENASQATNKVRMRLKDCPTT